MLLKNVRSVTLAIALALGGIAGTAEAYDETSTSAINVSENAVILKGYDAVAYFTESKPVQGKAEHQTTHAGATYYFASAANLKTFKADPSHYAPAYGGFCAMGAALGKKLDVDPSQFRVVDGKLYLNVNADVFKKWTQDVPGNIAKAEQNWPAIHDKAPKDL